MILSLRGTSLREATSVFSAFDVENEFRVKSKVALDFKFATKSLEFESHILSCFMRCERIVYLFSFVSLLSHCDCGGGGGQNLVVFEKALEIYKFSILW